MKNNNMLTVGPHTYESDDCADASIYRSAIIKMVQEIENEDYLFKIYHYTTAKYRREKEAGG